MRPGRVAAWPFAWRAGVVLLCACKDPRATLESAKRIDTPATAALARPAAPPDLTLQDCPGIDSLRVADSLTFHPAWAFQREPGVEPEHFCFALSDGVYRIATDGSGQRVDSRSTRAFQLEWEDASTTAIEGIFVRPYRGDVLLAFAITDGESGAAEIARLERATLRQRWHARHPSFNLGPPLVADSVAYVGAMGVVGRVNLETGKYDWLVRDLYDHTTGHFNSVDSIILTADTVGFLSRGAGRPSRLLLLHRETGASLGQRDIPR